MSAPSTLSLADQRQQRSLGRSNDGRLVGVFFQGEQNNVFDHGMNILSGVVVKILQYRQIRTKEGCTGRERLEMRTRAPLKGELARR